MSLQIPVDFIALAQGPSGQSASDYPYSIKARDLMRNFIYCALDADATIIENSIGPGGEISRKLKIPAVPSGGTHVLGAVGGELAWIATEEC
jgi:hypothetical protein